MKKVIAGIMALAMVAGFAFAEKIGTRMEVVNCKEWITLREEPSKKAESLEQMPLGSDNLILLDENYGDFAQISYEGEIGYALKEYLAAAETYSGEAIALDEEQRYNINLFLSNFTEQQFAVRKGFYSYETATLADILNFCARHISFNNEKLTEKGIWNKYDTRISDNKLPGTASRYLNQKVQKESAGIVAHRNHYFYWNSEYVPANSGFACFDSVEQLTEKRLSVHFRIYGLGRKWSNKVCRLSPEEVQQEYECTHIGHAVIDMGDGDLDDRREWFLERYAVTAVQEGK